MLLGAPPLKRSHPCGGCGENGTNPGRQMTFWIADFRFSIEENPGVDLGLQILVFGSNLKSKI